MSVVPLVVTGHVEGTGDMTVSGPQQFVGTKGQSRRLEGFLISPPSIPGVELEYMAHIEGTGDTHWHRNGQFVGSRGQSRRLEGFAIRLIGSGAAYYDVKYYAHVEGSGDTGVSANGNFVGSRGQSRRVEGLAVWLESKAPAYSPVPAYTPSPYVPTTSYVPAPYPVPTYVPAPVYPSYPVAPSYPAVPSYPAAPAPLTVTVCIQHQGHMTVYGQQFAGTKGQSRKIEAFSISCPVPGLEIEYMAHIEGTGDTHWHRNGQEVGRHHGGRIEGFAVRLCGPASGQFDVRYYGHLEGTGDSPVQSNGSFCGTRGQSRRCEGICVWLEPRRY